MSFRCVVCGGAESRLVLPDCPDTYLGTPFRVSYSRCLACSLLQQSPLPEDVTPFYPAYPLHTRKSRAYAWMRKVVMGGMLYDARTLGAGATLVDYGCGDGGYLETLAGRALRRVGYEPDPGQAARLAGDLGVPVHSDAEALVAAEGGNVDIVTLHMVLEHLVDPHAALRTIRRLLKPGGVVYVVVPHLDSFEARVFGRKWHNLDPPRHVFFPLPEHLRRLGERHELLLERHAGVSFPNGVAASLPVVLTGRFRFPLFALFMPLGILYSRLVPTGSRAYWLRRR